MIFLQKTIPTSRLYSPSADCDALAPDFFEVLGPARQVGLHAWRVVREPRRSLQWAFRRAGVRRRFYESGAELQNAGRSPQMAR